MFEAWIKNKWRSVNQEQPTISCSSVCKQEDHFHIPCWWNAKSAWPILLKNSQESVVFTFLYIVFRYIVFRSVVQGCFQNSVWEQVSRVVDWQASYEGNNLEIVMRNIKHLDQQVVNFVQRTGLRTASQNQTQDSRTCLLYTSDAADE